MTMSVNNLQFQLFPVIISTVFSTIIHEWKFLLIVICSISPALGVLYTNEFAVKVLGGEEKASALAKEYGFIYRGQVGTLQDYYIFEHHSIQKRSLEQNTLHHSLLKNSSSILWVEQQYAKRRVKRAIRKQSYEFPDPLYGDQWFLHGGGFGGYDMNIVPAWKIGYTGKGVVVSILDDGIQKNHPDLAQNYDKMASLDINGEDDDPSPQDNGDNKHGTRCAGEVAAVAFNKFCGVGVAYNASIGGVRMLDGIVTDATEAKALSHNPNHIHIYSASWGPEDDGKTVDGPGPLAYKAFKEGIKKGRSGLGSVFVWASGNGGRYGDSCNCDGYTNSVYTLSISSATQSGTMPWYLEQCSSTLATTYSSGSLPKDKSITTVDMDYTYSRDVQQQHRYHPLSLCTKSHSGTSASAPIAAGICALALEANPVLSWRDMQYLVVRTSRPEPLSSEDGWIRNGVGRLVSSKFGYGLMDAAAMVKLAKSWSAVPPQNMCETPPDKQERVIHTTHGDSVYAIINTTACKNTENSILFLEHVQVKVTLSFKPRGNLKIILVSPAQTPSTVLPVRPYDADGETFNNWPFMSVHFWGENPEGSWQLVIKNEGELESEQPGKLIEWSLIFYGTKIQPVNIKQGKRSGFTGVAADQANDDIGYSDKNIACSDKGFYFGIDGHMNCTKTCPEGFFGDKREYICLPCDKSCLSCYGPSYGNCLSCDKSSFLFKNLCLKSCPDDFYGDVNENVCLPCSHLCSTCSLDHSACTACPHRTYLYEQKCISACPSDTYFHKQHCEPCHPSCASCYGSGENECITCPSDKVSFHGACIRSCPEGYFDTENQNCIPCKRSCKGCENRNICNSCWPNWELGDSNKCRPKPICSTGFVAMSGGCKKCFKSCLACFNPEKNGCLYCQEGFYWLNGTCIDTCPDNYYGHNGECVSCGYMCKKCSKIDGSYTCISCRKGLVLHDGLCLARCPDAFYSNGRKHCVHCHSSCLTCKSGTNEDCMSCPPNYSLLNNKCYSHCPEKYYKNVTSAECIPCYNLCRTCTGPGPKQCSKCYGNSSHIDGMCIPCLDNEYFDPLTESCQKCHDKCGRCVGPSESHCMSCQVPLRLDEVNHICLPCCSSSDKTLKCCNCSQDLGICISSDIPVNTGFANLNNGSNELAWMIALFITVGACILISVFMCFLFYNHKSRCHLFRHSEGSRYEKVPTSNNILFDGTMETVSLTQDILDDDDDDDDVNNEYVRA